MVQEVVWQFPVTEVSKTETKNTVSIHLFPFYLLLFHLYLSIVSAFISLNQACFSRSDT